MISYSIQGADYSIRQEGEGLTAQQMLAIYTSYDWTAEWEVHASLQSAGKDNCPAGMSIVREFGVYLNLCPKPDGTVLAHIIHTAPSKFLGFIKTQKDTPLDVESLAASTAQEAIIRFVKSDNDWLLRHIK